MGHYDDLLMERKDDVALAERLLARDEAALRAAIDAYGPAVLGVAVRVISDRTLAEEVAQDVFLALWRRPGAYDPARGSLQAFLLGVARNKAVDLVRKEQSVRRRLDELAAQASTAPRVDESLQGAVEERQEVRLALTELSEVQREALVLAYFGGRTYREVAEELDIPEGTAKTRLRDGLIKLRELMGTKEGRR